MTPEEQFGQLAEDMASRGVKAAKMFGMPTLKSSAGKAFAGLQGDELVCKLGQGNAPYTEALALEGAHLFDPGMGRAMKDWVSIPAKYAQRWQEFAEAAWETVPH